MELEIMLRVVMTVSRERNKLLHAGEDEEFEAVADEIKAKLGSEVSSVEIMEIRQH